MRYIKFVCSNGYCGCDEEFYEKFEDSTTDHEIDEMGDELLESSYGFYYDDRFFDEEDYEDAFEAEDFYHENCSFTWVELSKEEWEEEAKYY